MFKDSQEETCNIRCYRQSFFISTGISMFLTIDDHTLLFVTLFPPITFFNFGFDHSFNHGIAGFIDFHKIFFPYSKIRLILNVLDIGKQDLVIRKGYLLNLQKASVGDFSVEIRIDSSMEIEKQQFAHINLLN